LFFVPPEKKSGLISALGNLESISIRVNAPGTQIVHASMKHEVAASERPAMSARAA
jgi:hypothetical protein